MYDVWWPVSYVTIDPSKVADHMIEKERFRQKQIEQDALNEEKEAKVYDILYNLCASMVKHSWRQHL